MRDEIREALVINDQFSKLFELAQGECLEPHTGQKWALVAIINSLKDEGMNSKSAALLLREFVDEVCGFISDLSDLSEDGLAEKIGFEYPSRSKPN